MVFLPLYLLRIINLNKGPLLRFVNLRAHDLLVTRHQLLLDRHQLIPTLGDDVLLGVGIQQVDVPIDRIQLVKTVGEDHLFIVGRLSRLSLDLAASYQIIGNPF